MTLELERVDSFGQAVVICQKERWPELARDLRDRGYELLSDLTCIDQLDNWQLHGCRFEVVVNLLSISHNERIRVRVPVDEDECSCPSVTDVWPGANFFEREAYDMFGVVFTDHPDLDRILMPEDWVGHPLRKDYGTGDIPVQFLEAGAPPPSVPVELPARRA